jgi:hypothetical protein
VARNLTIEKLHFASLLPFLRRVQVDNFIHRDFEDDERTANFFFRHCSEDVEVPEYVLKEGFSMGLRLILISLTDRTICLKLTA